MFFGILGNDNHKSIQVISCKEIVRFELMNALNSINSEANLKEFKDLTAHSFAEIAQKAIEALWDEGTINEETIEQWGSEHLRTTFHKPNETTKAAIAEAMVNKEKEMYDNVDELMKKLIE